MFGSHLSSTVVGPKPRLDGSVAEQGAKIDARGDVGDTCLTQIAAVPGLFYVARHSSERFLMRRVAISATLLSFALIGSAAAQGPLVVDVTPSAESVGAPVPPWPQRAGGYRRSCI